MYSIEYCKNGVTNKFNESNTETCKFVSGIIIDTTDLDIVIENSDNSFLKIYYRMLKKIQFKKHIPERITILNNNINNEKIIEMVIGSEYLIHETGISTNEEWYLGKRRAYQEEIGKLELSKDKNDRQKLLLMQYFIDTLDGYMKKRIHLVKESGN